MYKLISGEFPAIKGVPEKCKVLEDRCGVLSKGRPKAIPRYGFIPSRKFSYHYLRYDPVKICFCFLLFAFYFRLFDIQYTVRAMAAGRVKRNVVVIKDIFTLEVITHDNVISRQFLFHSAESK